MLYVHAEGNVYKTNADKIDLIPTIYSCGSHYMVCSDIDTNVDVYVNTQYVTAISRKIVWDIVLGHRDTAYACDNMPKTSFCNS